VGTAGQKEGEWAHAREPALTGLAHGATRERGESGRAGAGADRRGLPIRHRGHGRRGARGLG
jgi:hypothetical protein